LAAAALDDPVRSAQDGGQGRRGIRAGVNFATEHGGDEIGGSEGLGDVVVHAGGDAPILHNIHELGGDAHLPDFADLSPELTRPNRGLRLWLPLQLHGLAAFREALDHKLDLAERVYDTLVEMPQLQVLDKPDLSVIAFHCRIPQATQAEENHATKEMVRYVNASRRVYLSTTIIQARLIARIAILNLRTTAEIIEEVVDAIRTFVSQFAAPELESKVTHD